MEKAMDKQELKAFFIKALEKERVLRGWSQWEMAEKLEMSVSGYRKMISGVTDTISIFTAYTAAQVLNIPLFFLLEDCDGDKDELLRRIYTAPPAVRQRICSYLELEARFRHAQTGVEGVTFADVFTLTGYMNDGMIYDSMCVEMVEIRGTFEAPIAKGFRIMSDALLPVYAMNDILLIEERAAREGDTVVAMNLLTKKIYIRRVALRGKLRELRPLHGRGQAIVIAPEDKRNWFDMGCVVTSVSGA